MKGRNQETHEKWGRAGVKILLAAALCLVVIVTDIAAANATVCPCTCSRNHHTQTRQVIHDQHSMTRDFITAQFKFHQIWFLDTFFKIRILPAMMLMAEQLTAVGMHQMLIIGSFMDAQNQLDTFLLFQKKSAEAHRKYHPSVEMCSFGTMTRSLADAQRTSEFTASVLAKRALDRNIGLEFTGAGAGRADDRNFRIKQFIKLYCDSSDNLQGLSKMCKTAPADPKRINNDISFGRMVDHPRTINVDFAQTGTALEAATEEDIIALASNIYGHDVFDRHLLRAASAEGANDEYIHLRSIITKRAVAENSFNAIVGLKSKPPVPAGEEQSATAYMKTVLKELGVTSDSDMQTVFGSMGDVMEMRPSYYAQLELLTQRLYQNPSFYAALYDKPANVERKNVVLQAMGLMLDRNSFKSELRAESIMSVWLETELLREQEKIQTLIGGQSQRGKPGE